MELGAALAVRESALTSKRIRRDVAARAAQGLPHGKIPYGYRASTTRSPAL
jgi:site-specific DNA recombinase